jgi:putative tryptophan/tyrosine transport system substrate-binding protein
MFDMRRREFITLLGGAAAWPLAANAQQAENPTRIGFLPIGLPSNAYDQSMVEAFRQGLREAGLVDGRHVTIDLVWASNESEFPLAVSGLVQRGAKPLVTAGSSASLAAKRHTSTIPIVFVPAGNPVGIGLVESLSHPGGNVTGFSDVLADLSGKYVDFAMQLGKPQAPIAYIWHTEWPDGQYRFEGTERAAKSSGIDLQSRGIKEIAEVNGVIDTMKKGGALTLIVQPSPFTYRHRTQIVDSARSHAVGTIVSWPVGAREGALIAYGPAYAYMNRQAASYVARILKGAKPADLPVQEPTKFELVINLKTAKTLGLEVPPTLLALADEVIE